MGAVGAGGAAGVSVGGAVACGAGVATTLSSGAAAGGAEFSLACAVGVAERTVGATGASPPEQATIITPNASDREIRNIFMTAVSGLCVVAILAGLRHAVG